MVQGPQDNNRKWHVVSAVIVVIAYFCLSSRQLTTLSTEIKELTITVAALVNHTETLLTKSTELRPKNSPICQKLKQQLALTVNERIAGSLDFALACCHSELHNYEGAESSLLQAVSNGFSDIQALFEDSDLAALHESPNWENIPAAVLRVLAAREHQSSGAVKKPPVRTNTVAQHLEKQDQHIWEESFWIPESDDDAVEEEAPRQRRDKKKNKKNKRKKQQKRKNKKHQDGQRFTPQQAKYYPTEGPQITFKHDSTDIPIVRLEVSHPVNSAEMPDRGTQFQLAEQQQQKQRLYSTLKSIIAGTDSTKINAMITHSKYIFMTVQHSVVRWDINTDEFEVVVGSFGQAGWDVLGAYKYDEGVVYLSNPNGLALHGGVLYIADTGNDCIRAYHLETKQLGTVTRVYKPIGLSINRKVLYITSRGQGDLLSYDLRSRKMTVLYKALQDPTSVAAFKNDVFMVDKQASSGHVGVLLHYNKKSGITTEFPIDRHERIGGIQTITKLQGGILIATEKSLLHVVVEEGEPDNGLAVNFLAYTDLEFPGCPYLHAVPKKDKILVLRPC